MKAAQKQANNSSHRSTAEASQNSGQNPLAQIANNSKEAVAQRALMAGIADSPRMLAQRRQIEGYLGASQPRAGGAGHPASSTTPPQPIQRFEKTDDEDKAVLQGKLTSETPAQRQEAVPKTNNTGLPDNLKSGIESLSGLSMDAVRVHYNSSQPAQLNALAYAQGTDIHIAPGQEQHLPHEAWHVVQQAQGRVRPTLQARGMPINDDKGLEWEADLIGEKAARMKEGMLDARFTPVPRPESANALQKMAENRATNDVPVSQEEDMENHDALEPVESDVENTAMALEEAELSSEEGKTVTQAKVVQLIKRRQSNRIATNALMAARRLRRGRMGRHRAIVRFVPGAAVQTYLIPIADLGGNGLRCPIGSYIQRRNNFNYTGSRAGDIVALGGTPPGQVWHHYHDFVSTGPNAGHGTMYLLNIAQHRPGHRGGVYQWNNTAGNGVYG